jgi:hypothetical protein
MVREKLKIIQQAEIRNCAVSRKQNAKRWYGIFLCQGNISTQSKAAEMSSIYTMFKLQGARTRSEGFEHAFPKLVLVRRMKKLQI